MNLKIRKTKLDVAVLFNKQKPVFINDLYFQYMKHLEYKEAVRSDKSNSPIYFSSDLKILGAVMPIPVNPEEENLAEFLFDYSNIKANGIL